MVLGTDFSDSDKPTKDVRVHADIIISADGFDALRWSHPLAVQGRDGRPSHDIWDECGDSRACLGTGKNGTQRNSIATGLNTTNEPIVLISDDSMESVVRTADLVLKGDVLYVEPQKQIFSET